MVKDCGKKVTFEELNKNEERPLSEKERKKRNWNVAKVCICLCIFWCFDIASREILFQYSIPHLKMMEGQRTTNRTKISAIVSELSDKYAYIVIIGGSYHVMDVQNAFVVTVTIYTALGVLNLMKSYIHE